MSHLEIKNLYKIFGKTSEKALKMSRNGSSKEEILKKTGDTVGVNNVSFNVEQGETFVVMGLSGSGKSTLIRCLNRLNEPTSGEILLEGKDIAKATKNELRDIRRKHMGMVFQNFGLFPHKTIIQNVDYGLEIQGISLKERRAQAKEVLELVGLKGYEDMYPKELSGGMQQRVGLARALVLDPKILLMDEAFSALDPLIKKNMQDELIALQEKMQKTIVFITHDLDEALKIGDRIAVMYEGEVVQIGTPEQILTSPANDYVRDFVENVNRARVIKAESIMKKPLTVVNSKEGPKAALRKMDKEGISSVFVVDKDRKLQGVVSAEDASKLVDQGEKSLKKVIKDVEFESRPDALISDLLPMATQSSYPIAITDDEGRLLGVVVRVSVIAGIRGIAEGDDLNA